MSGLINELVRIERCAPPPGICCLHSSEALDYFVEIIDELGAEGAYAVICCQADDMGLLTPPGKAKPPNGGTNGTKQTQPPSTKPSRSCRRC